MKFNELTITSKKSRRRAGRGISAGRGKTAGRGTKGQGSRKSGGVRPGFEGGQMPLYMRLPKLRGFRSKRVKPEIIYTGDLAKLKTKVDNFTLYNAGLISSPYVSTRLILKGEVTGKKDVSLQSATETAINAVTSAGGSFKKVDRVARQPKKSEGETAKQ